MPKSNKLTPYVDYEKIKKTTKAKQKTERKKFANTFNADVLNDFIAELLLWSIKYPIESMHPSTLPEFMVTLNQCMDDDYTRKQVLPPYKTYAENRSVCNSDGQLTFFGKFQKSLYHSYLNELLTTARRREYNANGSQEFSDACFQLALIEFSEIEILHEINPHIIFFPSEPDYDRGFLWLHDAINERDEDAMKYLKNKLEKDKQFKNSFENFSQSNPLYFPK